MINSHVLRALWVTGTAIVTKDSVRLKKLHAENVNDHHEIPAKEHTITQQTNGNNKKDLQKTKSCIIVIGTTGTGKSSTISKYTNQNVTVSKSASSMTRQCNIYTNLRNPSEPVWVDTVGYDDSKNLKDEESFKEVLKFIDKHDLRDVQAIVNFIPILFWGPSINYVAKRDRLTIRRITIFAT